MMPDSDAATIRAGLHCGRSGCPCARERGNVHCPAHDDHNPSLSIGEGEGGRVLVHCQAGCPQDKVIAALREKDLWARNGKEPMTKPREVATYGYKDEQGNLLYQVVRYMPKDFRQRRPDGAGGWLWNLDGVRRVLYRLPELATMPTDAPVFIAEGEKDVDNLSTHLGLCATCNSGGVGKFTEDLREPLKGRHVIVIVDKDKAGRAHGQQVAGLLYGFVASVKVLELPGDGVKDASDWLAAGGTREALEALMKDAPEWTPAAQDGDADTAQADGQPPAASGLTPPTQPVDGAAILYELVAFVRRFVVLRQEQAEAIALWVAHTHAFEQADATPYLSITSPEKRSGKTRLLEALDLLTARHWLTGRVSPAVLYRKIERDKPTLLLDESDAAFASDKEYAEALRGVLNTGHRRGGVASLCVGVGAGLTFHDFPTFCPKAIAGIGKLPDTVADRAILIVLKRRTASEPVERFRRRDVLPEADALKEHVAAWAASLTNLRDARPSLPPELDDRAQDCWEPLLALADAAGGDWPRRARQAALALSGAGEREDASLGVRLLGDIKGLFNAQGVERLPSVEIVRGLLAIEESPWADLDRRPLDASKLARLLKPFGITPKTLRAEKVTFKGYERAVFAEAWERYTLTLPGVLPVTPVTLDTAQIQTASRNTDTGPQADVTGNVQIQHRYDVTPVTAKGAGDAGGGDVWEAAL
ncbi:MAG: DUF3631 domain-containing protein [Dehalococcoidia bacterium]|nr:DUF3631 domain-containing protein [Dehalococcoidia bacterium]